MEQNAHTRYYLIPGIIMYPCNVLLLLHELAHSPQVILDGGKGQSIGLPPTNQNGADMTPSDKLHPESRHQRKGAEPSVETFLKQTSKTAECFLPADDDVNAESEGGGSVHEGTSIEITRPSNDTVFLVGDVVVAFDTHGFTPSAETPIEAGLRRIYCISQARSLRRVSGSIRVASTII